MKEEPCKTESEKLFAKYLNNCGLRFRYEPRCFQRPPDFVIKTEHGPLVCEVKELGLTPEEERRSKAEKKLTDRLEKLPLPWGVSVYWDSSDFLTQDKAKLFSKLIKGCHSECLRENVPTEFVISRDCKAGLSLASEIAVYPEKIDWKDLTSFDVNDAHLQKKLSDRVSQSSPVAVAYALPDNKGKFPYPRFLLNAGVVDPAPNDIFIHICGVSNRGVTKFYPVAEVFAHEPLLGGKVNWKRKGIARPSTTQVDRTAERLREKISEARKKFGPIRDKGIDVACMVAIGSPPGYAAQGGPCYEEALIEAIKGDLKFVAPFDGQQIIGEFSTAYQGNAALQQQKNTTVSAICLLSEGDSGEVLLYVYRNPHAQVELREGIFKEIDRSHLLQ